MDGKLIDKIEDAVRTKDSRMDRISLCLVVDMSEKRKGLYWLIHPDGKGCTPKEAALELGISERAVHKMLKIMRKKYPEAFTFESIDKRLKNNAKDIKHIYDGYKRIATAKGLDFTLSVEDLEEIIQLPCLECEAEPTKSAVNTKTGNKFKYHHLGRFDTRVGYIYTNSHSICGQCIRKSGGIPRN